MDSSPDSLWGPQLPGQFDFTLFFEQSMLAIVPGGIIALLIPFYLRTAMRSTHYVRSGRLLWVKLAVGFILVTIQSSSLALWHGASEFRSSLALCAASMSLLASVGIVVILYVAHTYSLQPSAFLSVFLSLTMVFDIAMARSFFRRHGLGTIGALQSCVIILKLAIVVLEEVSKRTLFQAEHSRLSVSREGTAGFWNRATFTWLYPVLSVGFRKELSLNDLPEIGDEFDSLRNFDDFFPRWKQADKTSSLALAEALVCTLPWQLVRVVLPRLFFVLLKFSQPFLLLHIVQAVKDGGVNRDVSWALIFTTACVFGGITISGALQAHYHFRVMTIVRGILVVGIYDKMQKLGREDLVSAAAMTLMTTDTTGVEKVISLTYEVWSSSLQVALGIWSLYIFLGPACFLMLIPGSCSFLVSLKVAKKISRARTAWNQDIQHRVAATSTVIAQIKDVKATGMSQTVTRHLQEKRRKEIETSMQDRHARLWMFAFAALNNCVTPVLVLGGAYFWTRADDALSAAEVFTILAIVAIASQPLISILEGIMDWTVGFASLTRVQTFLRLRELEDTRQEGEWQVRSADPFADEEEGTLPPISRFAVRIVDMGFTSLIQGPILRRINMQIPWGSLAIIWGPINCGKSTLLKTIVGESAITSGTVKVGTKLIAYCSQHPWIQNQTVRNTVIGVCEFIDYRYNEVIHTCALDVDILHMPQGDQTMTGTGGCNLSGGQKQRLGLARALYEELEIIVLDDVLSALDADTAATVVSRLFGSNGLMRRLGRTVIMTTNRLEFLDYANLVYQMDLKGHIKLEERGGDDSASSSSAADSSTGQGEEEATADAMPLEPTQPPSVKPSADDKELQYARIPRQSGTWSLYAYYLLPAGLFWVTSWVIVMAISALIEKMPLIFVRIWYERDPNNPYYFVGFALFAVASIFCNTVMGMHFFFKILPKSAEEIHLNVLHSVVL